ncbi:MAG: AI-2E family transporter [FCB group bacterium]
MDNVSKNILIIILLVLVFYLLTVLSSLLIPLIFACLFAILFQPLILFLKKSKFPDFLAIPIVAIISLLILFGIVNIIIQTTSNIASEQAFFITKFNERFSSTIHWLNASFGFSFNDTNFNKEFDKLIHGDWLSNTISRLASGIGSFTGSVIIFCIYYLVILSGMSGYQKYIKYVGGDGSDVLLSNYEKVQKSIFSFMLLKTMTNLCAGVVVTLICLIFGLKFPIFWGFLTFIFDYIPTVGSIVAVLPPVIMGFIQYEDIRTVIFLLICLGGFQFTIGNVIEPKIIGNRLRLNTVAVIFGLVFWGYIWGIPGMMISIPLMVILKLIFEHIHSLNVVARLMGYPD